MRKIIPTGALLLLGLVQTLSAQTITVRYGQIPSTIKTVSALQFTIAQRKGFFSREGINLEMVPIEGGANNMIAALDKGTVDITRTAKRIGPSHSIHGRGGGTEAAPARSRMLCRSAISQGSGLTIILGEFLSQSHARRRHRPLIPSSFCASRSGAKSATSSMPTGRSIFMACLP
jgi:hypothetical protein